MRKNKVAAASLAAAAALAVPAVALPAVAQPNRLVTPTAPAEASSFVYTAAAPHPKVKGIDVSAVQRSINWKKVRANGIQFAYIKATEGTTFRDPAFNRNYIGATKAKVIRGAYHYPNPRSSAKRQANYFVDHGGGWSADNLTLPGQLDMEGPRRNPCWGVSRAAMVKWISDFVNQYHARTSRWPVIYSSHGWWEPCTGNSSAFRSRSPLMLARYNPNGPGTPIGHWATYTIWQYTDKGRVSGVQGNGDGYVDLDTFNGSRSRLLALANNTN